jgi:hypothetical protein
MKSQQQSDVVVPANQDAKQYARQRPGRRFALDPAGRTRQAPRVLGRPSNGHGMATVNAVVIWVNP